LHLARCGKMHTNYKGALWAAVARNEFTRGSTGMPGNTGMELRS